MKYETPGPMDRTEAARLLQSPIPEEVCKALLAVALHEKDWRWAQERCFEATRHASLEVRALSATCFGHLARVHGNLELDRVIPALRALQKEPELAGRVEDAIDDINMFMKPSPAVEPVSG